MYNIDIVSFASLSRISKAVDELRNSDEPNTPTSSNGLAKTE